MGQYNFNAGTSSHMCCEVKTDGNCSIIKLDITESEAGSDGNSTAQNSSTPGNTSMDVGLSTGSDSSSEIVCTYTISSIVTLFEEIVQTILSNELENYTPPQPIDETAMLSQIMRELQYHERYHDDNDSDNLEGYSDIISISSNSTFTINDVKDNYEDILHNIGTVKDYLNTA